MHEHGSLTNLRIWVVCGLEAEVLNTHLLEEDPHEALEGLHVRRTTRKT